MPDIPDRFPVLRKRFKSAYGTVIPVLHHVQTFCLQPFVPCHVLKCNSSRLSGFNM